MEEKLALQHEPIQDLAEDRLTNSAPAGDLHNKEKALAAMSLAAVFLAFGDVALSKGMKAVGTGYFDTLHAALDTVTNPFVGIGIALLIGFLTLYLAALSWENLSFVLPLTAAAYVIVTILAFFYLGEYVSPLRWAGSILVAIGVALVART